VSEPQQIEDGPSKTTDDGGGMMDVPMEELKPFLVEWLRGVSLETTPLSHGVNAAVHHFTTPTDEAEKVSQQERRKDGGGRESTTGSSSSSSSMLSKRTVVL